MRALFGPRGFAGFGPDRLAPGGPAPAVTQVHGHRAGTLRARLRELCPRRPGVYGMVDPQGDVIYIGKAKCLRSRLLSYFRHRSRDPKAGRILEHTRTIAWEPGTSEFAALLRELDLIRRWRPRFNVQGQPGRRVHTYVCLGRRPAPYVFLARRPPAGVLAAFGPVAAGHLAREAVRRCNDLFALRDCPSAQRMAFAEEAEFFAADRAAGCLRYEMGTCLGPCAAACTRAAYAERARAARAFLSGTDRDVLDALEEDMARASAEFAFERAAALRDKLKPLRWLDRQLGLLREAAERPLFVYPVRGHDGAERWYVVRAGRIAAVLEAPRDEPGRLAAARLLEQCASSHRVARLPATAELDEVLLVAGWFRRRSAERDRILTPAAALAAPALRDASGPARAE